MGAASSLAERQRHRRRTARALASALPAGALVTGDQLLVSRPKAMNFGLAPRDIVRGLLQAQRGTITTLEGKVYCQPWTHVAIVYRIQADREARRNAETLARAARAKASCLGGMHTERRMTRALEADGAATAKVLYADGHGIYVKKLTEFVSSVLNDGGTVVARRLRRPKKGARGALEMITLSASKPLMSRGSRT